MNTFFTDTTERGWLRVSGDDASTFLQGQLSNDLRKLTLQTAQLSSHSSAKGRMLAALILVRRGDDILIALPRSILDATLSRPQIDRQSVVQGQAVSVRVDPGGRRPPKQKNN